MPDETEKTKQYLEAIAEEIEMIAQRVDLDLKDEIEIEALQSDAFYYHIISQIFKEEIIIKKSDLRKFPDMEVGARIQYLIDYLSQTVLKVELEHINGFKICQGSLIDIKNFLQLINEMLNIQEADPLSDSGIAPHKGSSKKHKGRIQTESNDDPRKETGYFEKSPFDKNPNQKSRKAKSKSNSKKVKSDRKSSGKKAQTENRIPFHQIEQHLKEFESSLSSQNDISNPRIIKDKINTNKLEPKFLSDKKVKANESHNKSAREFPFGVSKVTPPKHQLSDFRKSEVSRNNSSPKANPIIFKQHKNFSKKSKPEIIRSIEPRRLNKNPPLSAKVPAKTHMNSVYSSKESIIQAVESVGQDPKILKVMKSSFLDPDKLQETLNKTNQKYQEVLHDYHRYTQFKKQVPPPVSQFTTNSQTIKSMQIFDQRLNEKMTFDRNAHEHRVNFMKEKFLRRVYSNEK